MAESAREARGLLRHQPRPTLSHPHLPMMRSLICPRAVNVAKMQGEQALAVDLAARWQEEFRPPFHWQLGSVPLMQAD